MKPPKWLQDKTTVTSQTLLWAFLCAMFLGATLALWATGNVVGSVLYAVLTGVTGYYALPALWRSPKTTTMAYADDGPD